MVQWAAKLTPRVGEVKTTNPLESGRHQGRIRYPPCGIGDRPPGLDKAKCYCGTDGWQTRNNFQKDGRGTLSSTSNTRPSGRTGQGKQRPGEAQGRAETDGYSQR